MFRVLLTGIHRVRTGEAEVNLLSLSETARLPYLPELIARKNAGPEQSTLAEADFAVYETEYLRLRVALEAALEASQLPELPGAETRAAINDLLVRLHLRGA